MGWTDDEIEKRVRLAEAAGGTAAERVPDIESWGLFAYGDASGASGGGVGSFLWFQREEDLLNYTKSHIVFLSPGPSSSDPQEVEASVHITLDLVSSGQLDYESGRVMLNKALKHYSQIEWWGTMQSLCSDDSKFAGDVRAWFRSQRSVPNGSRHPVQNDEMLAFASSLQDYGQ